MSSLQPVRVLQSVGTMNHGGIEHFIMNLYRNIDRDRVQFDFAYRVDEECVFDDEIHQLGGRIFRFQSPDRHPMVGRRFYEALFAGHPEIVAVHEHRTDMSGFLGCLRAAREAGVQVRIVHSHNSKPVCVSPSAQDSIRTAWHLLNRHLAGDLVTHRVACSDLAADWMFGAGSGASIVNNGIDTAVFGFDEDKRHEVRAELGIPYESLVIGNVGRFAPQKNQAFLLDVLEAMPEGSDVRLLIVGDGPLMDELRDSAARRGLLGRVCLPGMQAETARFYSAMDVLCMPSRFEGLPVSAVEAQTSGLPVLFSDNVSRLSALTERCSFLSLDEGPKRWADELLRLCAVVRDRHLGVAEVRTSGFDASDAAELLTSIYLAGA